MKLKDVQLSDISRVMKDCQGIFFILLVIALFVILYMIRLRHEVEGYRVYTKDKKREWTNLILLLLGALLIKLIFAAHYDGHGTDMNCFRAWSEMIYENGITKFYYLDAFTDYPPGYMAILWVVAAVRHLFGIDTMSAAGRILIKFVPIVSDLVAGGLIYHMAKKKFSEGSSLMLAGMYALNPAVVLNSSIWGQVDGVFTLCLLFVCYLCMEQKRIPAYFVFVIGVLIKPQMLMFAPILIWTIAEQVFLHDFNKKKMVRDLVGGLAAIGTMFLLAAPFGLDKVVPQYVNTLSSYEYCTINAYNVWALAGKNWVDQSGTIGFLQYKQIGTLAILAAVCLSGFLFFKMKEDKSRYFMSMSVVAGTMFLFSVRMHERYLFPVLVLTLAAFVLKPTREMFFTYVGYSVVQFINVAHVLWYFVVKDSTAPEGGIMGMTALLTLGVYGYMFFANTRKTKMEDLKEAAGKEKE